MSSAGHVLDMMRRMKQNRSMMKQAREKLKDVKTVYDGTTIDNREFNPDFEDKLNSQTRKTANKAIRSGMFKKSLIVWGKTIIVVSIVFYLIWNYIL